METILVATDFSEASQNAADYAIELAKLFSAKLVFINAYNLPYSTFEAGTAGDVIEVLRESASKGLEQLKKHIETRDKHHFDISCYADIGIAEDVIIEVANKTNAELIVMGIVGNGGKIKENLIGSTAIKVARNTKIPVMIIPEGVSYHPIRKISFACDLNKTEQSDLIYVSRYFGKLFDAELEIVNVEEPNTDFSPEKSKTCDIIDKKLENIKHTTVFISESKSGKALEEYFEDHETDMILVRPRKHNLFENFFSHSVSKELAFHSKVPLLCVQ